MTNKIVRSNFYLSREMYKKNLVILVNNQGFYYDHDQIVDAVYSSRFSPGKAAHISWQNGSYSRTKGYPNWAKEFIKNID
jgi:hypothetical protein